MTKIEGSAPPPRPVESGSATVVQGARSGGNRSAPIAAAAEADSLKLTGEATGLRALARELGSAPAGIDMARVNAIRASLGDGSYRVDPQAIASRMIEFDRPRTA